MLSKILVVFLLLFFAFKVNCFKSHHAYQKIIPTFLKHFVQSFSSPTRAVLLLCYRPEILIQITQDVGVPVTFKQLELLNASDFSRKHLNLFVVDQNCPNVLNILENLIEEDMFKHPFRWLIFLSNGARLPKITTLVDSNIFVVSFNKSNICKFAINQSKFSLSISSKNFKSSITVYQLDKASSNILEPYGQWTCSKGFEIFLIDRIISKRRRNLRHKTITSSFVVTHNDSLNHLDDYKNKHVDSVTKVNFVITRHLIECLNATMKYRIVSTWGYPDSKTGTWNGMIKDMIEKKADIGGTALFITTERMAVIEYISSTSPTLVQFILREPPLSFVRDIYSLPFTSVVWFSSGLLVGLTFVIFFLTIKFQSKIFCNNFVQPQDIALSAISAICQMGTYVEAKILSSRIATIFTLVTILFLYTSYTANIVALLQSTSHSIQTLTDILNSDLEVGVDDTPFNRYFFESATEPVRRKIYETKVFTAKGESKFMNITEGVARLRKGLFAFHVELGVGYKIIEETFFEHEKCNLKTIQFIQGTVPWYSIQKESPYKEMLKVNVFRIREYGLQYRENSRIYTKKPICATHQQSFESVRLIDCYAPMRLLIIGYLLTIIIFVLEAMIKFRERNKKQMAPVITIRRIMK